MKPYYEEKDIVIYHGDCREILQEIYKCDLLLTDPPYGAGLSFDYAERFSPQPGSNRWWEWKRMGQIVNGSTLVLERRTFELDIR